jgi:hypothetical protein
MNNQDLLIEGKDMWKVLLANKIYRIEFVTYLVMVAISVFMLFYVWGQPWTYRKTQDGLGLAPFPVFFLLGMFLFGLLSLHEDYKSAVQGIEPSASDVTGMDWKSTLLLCVFVVVYPPAIWIMDPLVYAALFSLIVLLIGHVRQIWLIAISMLGIAGFIYIFMIRIAEVFFPVIWLY